MRKPTLEDIAAVRKLLAVAKDEPVGERLADILKNINREDYIESYCVIANMYSKPEIKVAQDGHKFIELTVMNVVTKKEFKRKKNLDKLKPQFRWDFVCNVWNVLRDNTDEIPDL